jgi:hypothetical protein
MGVTLLSDEAGDVSAPRCEEVRMDTPAPYLHWYFILISVPNLVLIMVMLALFALALIAPFPGHGDSGAKRKR